MASAQSPEDRETARTLFDEGKTRRDRGDMNGALESFKAADALMNAPTTKLAVARAYAALGRLIESREAALNVAELRMAGKETQPFSDARAAAAQLATELGARIPSIAIELKGMPADRDAIVTVDGAAIPKDALKAPRRLNPGNHVVVAQLGEGQVRQDFTLAEKEQKSVMLDMTQATRPTAAASAAPAAPAASASTAKATPAEEPAPSKPADKAGMSPVVWAGLGVAALGVIAGSTAGILSISAKSDADAICRDDRCPPQGYDALDSANRWATISTIGFASAGAGVALAAIGYFVLGKKPPAVQTGSAARDGVRVSPWISAGGLGATGTF